jgi:O-antigen ligase
MGRVDEARERSNVLWIRPHLVLVVGGTLLALAITSIPAAPLLLIVLLTLSIVAIALIGRGDSDVILCLTAVGAFFLPMNNVRLTSTLTVGDGFIAAALIVAVTIRANQRAVRVMGTNTLLVGILLIVFGGLLGAFFAPTLAGSLGALGRFAGATLALPVLFGLWRPSLNQLRTIGASTVFGSVASAGFAPFGKHLFGRALGLTNHPNHLALASVMATGVAVGLLLTANRRSRVLLLFTAVAVLTLGIVLSGSRGGLVGEVLVAGVIALLTRDRKLVLLMGSVLAVAVPIFAFGAVGQNGTSALARLVGGGGVVASDQARAESLRTAIGEITQHPFTGRGLQNAVATHDIVLEITASAGVLGLVGLCLISWTAIRPIWRRYHWGAVRSRTGGDVLLIGTIGAVVGFLANGLFAPQLYDRYIWMVITMAVALNYQLDAAQVCPDVVRDRS